MRWRRLDFLRTGTQSAQMTAYYNDNDKHAVAVLKQAISDGVIAPGEVDERSIKEVQPDDLRGFTQCHFFAGAGCWAVAARQAGWADDRPLWTGSCPCQPFSIAGRRKGYADERHLWPSFFRLISECRPPICVGEQVAGKIGLEWFAGVRADMEECGYACGGADLCAAGVGAPHRRQRIYWVANANSEGRQARYDETEKMGYRNPTVAEGDRGFWSGFEAHQGDDGALRRSGPGIFPVAHGVAGRSEMLRLVGNSIVIPLAAEFLGAVMKIKRQGTQRSAER